MLQGITTRETRDTTVEIKFLLTPAKAAEVIEWARRTFAPDPHGSGAAHDEYRTTSLYFDTDAHDVYQRRGSFGRCKYRIRRYDGAGAVFLERKLRTPRLMIKRRTALGIDKLQALGGPPFADTDPGYWFQRRIQARQLHPVCQVSYRRFARVGTGALGPIRLTIDRDVEARPTDGLAFQPDGGVKVFGTLMPLEMKFRRELPPVFKEMIETFRLERVPVSKYRLSMDALGQSARGLAGA